MAYIVNKLRLKGRIGVYGRSIGGLTACHLANKYNNLVQSLIVDRSFYELSSVPEGKIKGSLTLRLFDLLTWTWRTKNHSNFVTTRNCYKIVTCDPLDDTVDIFGNLATGVCNQLAEVNYETEQYRQFYDTLLKVFSLESQLHDALTEDQQETLTKDLTKFVEVAESDSVPRTVEIKEEQITSDSPNIYNQSTSLNRSDSESIISSEGEDKKSSSSKRKKHRLSTKKINFGSFSDPETQLPKEFSMHAIIQMPWHQLDTTTTTATATTSTNMLDELDVYRKVLHLLVICISEVSAGTMLFQDVLGINRLPNYREFTAFLQTMEVYGAGYNDDVDYFRYNKRNTETHMEAMVKQLKRVIECYDLAVKLIEKSKVATKTSIVTSMFKSQFLCLLHFQKSLFAKLMATQ